MKFDKAVIDWLLEEDNSTVRYLTLKNLVKLKETDPKLVNAHKKAISNGVEEQILKHMKSEGYWVKPGAGYNPKYRSAVWSLITLSQIGAKVEDDPRIEKVCKYYLDHAFLEGGYLSYNGTAAASIDCLQGNMCAAFTDLDFKDPRIDGAFDLMARYVTGDGIAPKDDKKSLKRYNYYKQGPGFVCKANGDLPCGWGAVKVMLALSKLPKNKRTEPIKKAITRGVEFLLNYEPVLANYPTRNNIRPNRSWFKFGFPVFYVTDVLQNVEALINLGFAENPKVKKAIDFILSKRDEEGRWKLEYSYNKKTWSNWGVTGKPSKWVTYRVYNILKDVY